jgi:ferrochelatase
MAKRGLMICNIGTPNSHGEADVGRYLREFLMDEEIITLPYLARWILVNIGIVPRRKKTSAKNYHRIWTAEGSPLMVYSKTLLRRLQQDLGDRFEVAIGMRYGDPSIASAMKKFKEQGIEELTILPLYPQYARASTESVFKKVDEMNRRHKHGFKIQKIRSFHDAKEFINAVAEISEAFLAGKKVDHYLMTYHGLPESQNSKMLPEKTYQQQCLETSEAIAKRLGLARDQWTCSFQSRVGVAQWIKPYTDGTLRELGQKGIKNLAVLCPSFVSDCLETIDEIGVEGKHTFKEAGGENFYLIPCVNDRTDYLLSLLE